MSIIFYVLVGGLTAYFMAPTAFMTPRGDVMLLAVIVTVKWFFVGAILASAVRFVGPKREHVITLLGTLPLHVLKTGIRLTLPWPLGWLSKIIHTDIQAKKVKPQIKSSDNMVFDLPVTIQHRVIDSMKYAFERDNPDGQMENLSLAAIRAAGNSMGFLEIYADKQHIKAKVDETIAKELASFGVEISELVVEDPILHDTTAKSLNGIREAEFNRQAATHQAETTFTKMVGEARAEAESTRLKGAALAGFRLKIAEGNAAAIAVMQGKLAVVWEDQEIGEGDAKTKIKVPKYVTPPASGQVGHIPEVDIDPGVILEFFKIVDSNDAIRDAASKPGTVIVAPAGGSNVFDFAKAVATTKVLPKVA